MHMETSYIVTADTEESIAKIASLWGYEFAEIDNCSFASLPLSKDISILLIIYYLVFLSLTFFYSSYTLMDG